VAAWCKYIDDETVAEDGAHGVRVRVRFEGWTGKLIPSAEQAAEDVAGLFASVPSG